MLLMFFLYKLDIKYVLLFGVIVISKIFWIFNLKFSVVNNVLYVFDGFENFWNKVF